MARRHGMAQAFRNNRHLQQFVLTDVTPTGKVLGTGSYGSVEEVKYQHLICAGKKIHEALIDAGNEGVPELVQKYEQECQLMSSLRHPNITLFLGLCFLPGTRLPLLVMERLETSLDDLLEHMPGLPLSLKRSVLEDVASGLVYLHKRTLPVIHRDLTAKNVLLTSSFVAKITDMGNSRIVDMRPSQMARTLSKLPGTLVYMPPEALGETHRYGPSLDIFSFGHLALYTLIQKYPGDLLQSTFVNPDNPQLIHARSELERRGEYIAILDHQVSCNVGHPALVQLVKQCLHNAPTQRPATDEVLDRLQRMKVEVEGEYGENVAKLDYGRLRLAKEMKMKDRRIEELTQQQERHQTELEDMTRELQAQEREKNAQILQLQNEMDDKIAQVEQLHIAVEEKDEQLQLQDGQLQLKDQQLQAQEREKNAQIRQLQNEMDDKIAQVEQLHIAVDEKDGQLQLKDEQFQLKDQQLQELRADLELRESRLREELQTKDAEISRLTEELRRWQEGTGKVPLKLKFPLQLKWRRDTDMPFEMCNTVQAVVMQGMVYVGGGYTGYDNKNKVMVYDIHSGEWAILPPYKTGFFGMTVIDNQLVLVGGKEVGGAYSKVLGAWKAASKEWVHPYPDMPTARHSCSVVTYKEWLVVAGGSSEKWGILTSVEVMNTSNKHWSTAPPLPVGWSEMKVAIVGDMCYFMSGFISGTTKKVFSVSLQALLNPKSSSERDRQIWKEISELDAIRSTPLSISGSLLALGGVKDGKDLTTIQLYQPETGKWLKVGDLPHPRSLCNSVMINDREMMVVGGYEHEGLNETNRTDIALISY